MTNEYLVGDRDEQVPRVAQGGQQQTDGNTHQPAQPSLRLAGEAEDAV